MKNIYDIVTNLGSWQDHGPLERKVPTSRPNIWLVEDRGYRYCDVKTTAMSGKSKLSQKPSIGKDVAGKIYPLYMYRLECFARDLRAKAYPYNPVFYRAASCLRSTAIITVTL